MNKIWCFMILAGLIVSSFNGKITTLSDTILSSSKEAVELVYSNVWNCWVMVWTHEHCSVSWNYYTTSKAVNPFSDFFISKSEESKSERIYQYKYCRKYIRSWLGCNSFRIKSYGKNYKKITLTKTPQQMKCVRS
mgnify:CR=1 FL=1